MRPRFEALACAALAAFPTLAAAEPIPPDSVPALTARNPAFDPGMVPFQVHYHGEISPYKIDCVFLMPGEVLELSVPKSRSSFSLAFGQGRGSRTGAGGWEWRAPDSAGLFPLTLSRDGYSDTVLINAFVMVRASEMKGGYLRGYHIGAYPARPRNGSDFYRPPPGFIRADAGTISARLSPHFTLGQFLCKQTRALPAYLVLRERLILKLEMVLDKANEAGYACGTFHVMSGYRTPFYNHVLGNVRFSAHQFGGAADIFIDVRPQDGIMDDVNGDGKIDIGDAKWLSALVDRLSASEFFEPYAGGIGGYEATKSHGPFVHVDVRGFPASW